MILSRDERLQILQAISGNLKHLHINPHRFATDNGFIPKTVANYLNWADSDGEDGSEPTQDDLIARMSIAVNRIIFMRGTLVHGAY